MISLGDNMGSVLLSQPETGNGLPDCVGVSLRDGRRFDRVTITQGVITQIDGKNEVPSRKRYRGYPGDPRAAHAAHRVSRCTRS